MKDEMNELRDIALARKLIDEKAAEEKRRLELLRQDEFSKKVDALVDKIISSFKSKCADLPYSEFYYAEFDYPKIDYDDKIRFIDELNRCFKKQGILIQCKNLPPMDGYSDDCVQAKLNLY